MNIGSIIEFRETSVYYRIDLRYGVVIKISDEQFYEDDTQWETMYTIRCFTNLRSALSPLQCKFISTGEYCIEKSDIHDEYYILDTGKINNYVVLSSI